MAEAAVVATHPQPQKRFYCHVCNVELENVTNEFTCPLCAGGFIEELPAPADISSDIEMMEPEVEDTYLDNRLTDELSSLFMSVTRPPTDEDDSAQNLSFPRVRRRNRRRIPNVGNLNNFDNILHDLLVSVTSGAGTSGNTPMFFMGNPGDYAWGREGLDTIVTQLLNQMDSSGPPPLPKDQIQEIPKVEVSQDQVEIKLQCSVCFEDFQLHEIVRKLSCCHVYHENCIVPWLELHGTCPVCRKSFVPDYAEEHQRNQFSAAANSIRNVAAFMRSNADLGSDTPSTPSTEITSTSSQSLLGGQPSGTAVSSVVTNFLNRLDPQHIHSNDSSSSSNLWGPPTSTTSNPQQQDSQSTVTSSAMQQNSRPRPNNSESEFDNDFD